MIHFWKNVFSKLCGYSCVSNSVKRNHDSKICFEKCFFSWGEWCGELVWTL